MTLDSGQTQYNGEDPELPLQPYKRVNRFALTLDSVQSVTFTEATILFEVCIFRASAVGYKRDQAASPA